MAGGAAVLGGLVAGPALMVLGFVAGAAASAIGSKDSAADSSPAEKGYYVYPNQAKDDDKESPASDGAADKE